ncbi:hypothetical protein BOO86_27190 [Mycobacterium sp. CBMA 234]|uniref:hypothetical protein n=1 Tax=Mycolicibacterium sp. CBMA 234 TaxID=1918495 RepID=UPI0012DECAA1|nr:hypothetical protein [Mycolicibacterium sp. CBMA 234]MUL68185.1 hypothetical protein [Mycolicibacterium sp. CBMA 234]
MIHVQEANLAWSLIEAVKPQLDERERNHVFISVGAGDSFTAIRILVKLIAVKQIPLQPQVIQLCATWLEAYALHEDHERLQLLIEGFAPADKHRSLALPLSVTTAKPPAALLISAAASRRGGCWPNRHAAVGTGMRIA